MRSKITHCKYKEITIESEMRVVFGVLIFALTLISANGRPGEVLGDSFPKFEKQGAIYAAAEAPDGGFFVMGDFTAVDGVPRPGLAKLDANGNLDRAFAPKVKPDFVDSTTLATQEPREQLGYYWGNPLRPERLLPLSNGGVIVIGEDRWGSLGERWEVRTANGESDTEALSEIVKSGPMRATPLFEQSGRLFVKLKLGDRSEFRAYRCEDFSSDPILELPENIEMIFPAPEGMLWGVFNGADEGEAPQSYVKRLFFDGSTDQSFDPIRDLSSGASISGTGPDIMRLSIYQPRLGFGGYYPVKQKIGACCFSPENNQAVRINHEFPYGGYAGAFAVDCEIGLIAVDLIFATFLGKQKKGKTRVFKFLWPAPR